MKHTNYNIKQQSLGLCILVSLIFILLSACTSSMQMRKEKVEVYACEDTIGIVSVSDYVKYQPVGAIVSANDTIKFVLQTIYFNIKRSPRCNTKLAIYTNNNLYGYYPLGGDYYTFFVENNILNCINKESKYVTKISFSNGIAESIFIYYDDTYGDYYTLDTENKDTTYWNFLMKYNSYRFKQ